jgi:hypothetical protein
LAFDPRLVLGFDGAGGVDEAAIMRGELRVGAVEPRVVDVGLEHPGLEVVAYEATRAGVEEGERLDVTRRPGALVHRQDRAHEHVAAEGEHHHEGPHPAPAPKRLVEPPPEVAIVDLGLVAGVDVWPPRRRRGALGLIWQLAPEPAAKARQPDGEALLVA